MPKAPKPVDIGVDIGGTFTDIVCRRAGEPIRALKIPHHARRSQPGGAERHRASLRAISASPPPTSAVSCTARPSPPTRCSSARARSIGLITSVGFQGRPGDRPRSFARICTASCSSRRRRCSSPPARSAGRRSSRSPRRATSSSPSTRRRCARPRPNSPADGVRGHRRVLPVLLPQPRARTAHARDHRTQPSRHAGVAFLRGRPRVPRIRAHRRHRLRCLHEARCRPLSATAGGGLAAARVTAPLQIMQSRGGLAGTAVARRRPVRLFLSGPAAGVIGGASVGRMAGHQRPDHHRRRRHLQRHRPGRGRPAGDPSAGQHRRLSGARADGRRERDRRRRRLDRLDRRRRRPARRPAFRRLRPRPRLLRPRRRGCDGYRRLGRARLARSRLFRRRIGRARPDRWRARRSSDASPGRSASRSRMRHSACTAWSTRRWSKAFGWCRSGAGIDPRRFTLVRARRRRTAARHRARRASSASATCSFRAILACSPPPACSPRRSSTRWQRRFRGRSPVWPSPMRGACWTKSIANAVC